MSQRAVSNIIERQCDGCGKTIQFDSVKMMSNFGVDESYVQDNGLDHWYTIVREVVVGGQIQKLGGQACSAECVPVVVLKLVYVPQTAEEIDLDSLRNGSN